jgi:hypothetical protein
LLGLLRSGQDVARILADFHFPINYLRPHLRAARNCPVIFGTISGRVQIDGKSAFISA